MLELAARLTDVKASSLFASPLNKLVPDLGNTRACEEWRSAESQTVSFVSEHKIRARDAAPRGQ